MIIRRVLPEEKEAYNKIAKHPLQTWEWGDFKEKTGMKPVRLGFFEEGKLIGGAQVLFRSLPKVNYSIGYLPKGDLPTKELINALRELAIEEKAIFIKLEPDFVVHRWLNNKGKILEKPIEENDPNLKKLGLQVADKALFDPHSFILDLTPTESELLSRMHSKTRYNIRLAQRSGVKIVEKSDQEGLNIFIELLQKTLKRQGFYMHGPSYFEQLWPILSRAKIAHIFLAKYQESVLSAWMIFTWGKKLYYPYGASSDQHRNLMASNLLCWEVIKFGKKEGCSSFDMWGSLGPGADPKHPWYGFHRFKKGYSGDLVRYVGSWDLVLNSFLYRLTSWGNRLRWIYLRIKQKLPF